MILVGVSLAVQTNLSSAKQSENVTRAFFKAQRGPRGSFEDKSHELTFFNLDHSLEIFVSTMILGNLAM